MVAGCSLPLPQPATNPGVPCFPHPRHRPLLHPLLQLVALVMEHLEGAYAVLVKSRHYPGQLVACKRGSPLILGLRQGGGGGSGGGSGAAAAAGFECFLASDASAVVEHTKK